MVSESEDRPADGTGERRKAVAIQDDRSGRSLPKVVATGRGAVAEQILQIAFAHGVKVREDADLAEILSVIDVDSPVPVEALAAVAEILAYVYRANSAITDLHGPAPKEFKP